MKKVLILALVAFAAVQSFAVGLGVRDAYVVGGMTGDYDDFGGSGDALTFEMLFPVNSLLGVHVGAGVEFASYSAEGESASAFGVTVSSADTYLLYFDFSVPVMARFNIASGFFAEAGLNLGLNLGTWGWVDIDDSDVESVDDASAFNVDLAVGAGYIFNFGLGLDARFTYGLTDAVETKVLNKTISGGRYALQFALSYWFKRP